MPYVWKWKTKMVTIQNRLTFNRTFERKLKWPAYHIFTVALKFHFRLVFVFPFPALSPSCSIWSSDDTARALHSAHTAEFGQNVPIKTSSRPSQAVRRSGEWRSMIRCETCNCCAHIFPSDACCLTFAWRFGRISISENHHRWENRWNVIMGKYPKSSSFRVEMVRRYRVQDIRHAHSIGVRVVYVGKVRHVASIIAIIVTMMLYPLNTMALLVSSTQPPRSTPPKCTSILRWLNDYNFRSFNYNSVWTFRFFSN